FGYDGSAMEPIERRACVTMVTGRLLAAPRFVEAQQAEKVVRVGFLDAVSQRDVPWLAAFERRLMELGYVEGKNLVIEFRTAGGRADRLQDLAAELVRLKPDVIAYLGGPDGAQSLKRATRTISRAPSRPPPESALGLSSSSARRRSSPSGIVSQDWPCGTGYRRASSARPTRRPAASCLTVRTSTTSCGAWPTTLTGSSRAPYQLIFPLS